ncbi:gamma-glutamyl hercynylcysteine S-oxide synthase [Anaerolineae bacterium]|nr:gamma-glutamyl hercynylcysteine S-oxide synthase [Anaerolineae bacterium]
MPPKFFITHSWKDIEFARRLCDDLHANGLAGFFDAYSIKPGDMVPSEIARGLEACDVYVPVLSYAALASPWCDEEINAAITLGKMPGRNGRPRIIPILIENCQDKMSVFLHNRLYIVFTNRYDDAFHELVTKGFGVSVASPAPKVTVPPALIIQTLPRTIINPKTGKEMILIPAGEFVMGSNDESNVEKPPHKVYLDAFYIARYPVTNAEYKKFVDATRYQPPEHWTNGKIPSGKENHPVVFVKWNDAKAYAQWTGARLPTEAEWEKAASWDDEKRVKHVYPWGDQFDANKCNTRESGIMDTTPVGKYLPQGDSAYGVGDMAGSVWEWCADWYDEDYYKNSPGRNPRGPASGWRRVLRGGSWSYARGRARGASRFSHSPVHWTSNVGFRFVVSSSLKS